MARSPVLTADGATRGKYEDVTGHTMGRRMIEADEVQLLAPTPPFKVRTRIGETGAV
jgi:hypothetical protein